MNVAAVVKRLNMGRRPLSRQFDRTPALSGTGMLKRWMSSKQKAVSAKHLVVEVGTTLEYAGLHQWGGTSIEPISETARQTLKKLLKSKRGKVKRERKKGGLKGTLAAARAGEDLRRLRKLGFIFQEKTLVTNINQRPFLGVTDQAETKIRRLIEEKLGGK
jgi:phage gpG-like protein